VYWRYVEQKAVNICQLYGYDRIDMPAFEDARLFSRSVGEETDIVEKEMYTFEDRGGNKLTLLPEGTASVCRIVIIKRQKALKISSWAGIPSVI
jgi:histidyl-tRNA synthetase